MDSGYSALVSRVLKNDVLVAAAKKMSEPEYNVPTLNLVTNNWEAVIDNDLSLQRSEFPFEGKPSISNAYHYETAPRYILNVTLVGNCRFSKPYEGKPNVPPGIAITYSEPLMKLTRIMTRDVHEAVEISENFKFDFKECSVLTCNKCKENHAVFIKNGYKLTKCYQPCITTTKVFDGEKILNRFHSFMEEAFSQNFLALMHLKINKRYNFLDKSNRRLYRISGFVTNFVAFNEAKLDFVNPIDIGELSHFALAMEKPSKDPEPAKETESVKEERGLQEKRQQKEAFSMQNSTELHALFSGSGIPEDEFNLIKESEEKKMPSELAIGDDISMVRKIRVENEYHPDSKRPRVEEDFLSIEGGCLEES